MQFATGFVIVVWGIALIVMALIIRKLERETKFYKQEIERFNKWIIAEQKGKVSKYK